MSFCKHCVQGVTHEGTEKGKREQIGGVECYVATPSGEYPKEKGILFLTDVFGIELINARLLVDDFAANGFRTIAPDLFNGDPFSKKRTLDAWFEDHGAAQTRPNIDKVISALKDEGVTRFGAVGYCFGGRYVFDLAFDNAIVSAIVCHPSRLQIPADLEKYFAVSKAPLLINSCTFDSAFPAEAQAKADEIFGEGKFEPGYKREYFEGCTHGFAVRGDLNDPVVKAGKEGAFIASVEWFIAHL